MIHPRKLTTLLPQSVRYGLRRILFRGDAATCVLCRSRVRGFHAHGGGAEVLDRRQVVGGMRRTGDRCPVCHGCDRTRMMMLYLETRTPIGRAPQRVLHVAPDFGLYLWLHRQPQVAYTATDIDIGRYRHIEGMQYADLTALPFASESFDLVICSHVLEHVPDDRAAFSELHRVLAPGGQALLLTPYALDGLGTDEDSSLADPGERARRFGQWDHVRIYDRTDFLNRMKEAGFRVSLFDPTTEYLERARDLHLNPLEMLPVGGKPLS